MKILRTIAEVREHRAGRDSVALVPTMGAFHEGHLELMRRARSLCSTVYVSLFVNPTQFGPGEDFAAYPRDEERDLALMTGLSVDAVFMPSVEEIYGGPKATVHVSVVSDRWEGEHRPGHFDGVATVVAKLFNIVQPDVAVFGLKDLQQCAVVRSLVEGLRLPVQLEFVETVREASGLAMSSRNAYFDDKQRADASRLYSALKGASRSILAGDRVSQAVELASTELNRHGFLVEYIALVDPLTMEPCEDPGDGLRLIAAARFGSVRLIDNVPLA